MADFRPRHEDQVRVHHDHFAADTVVLEQETVARYLAGDECGTGRGDVIDGLRNGLVAGTIVWIVVFLAVSLIFQ